MHASDQPRLVPIPVAHLSVARGVVGLGKVRNCRMRHVRDLVGAGVHAGRSWSLISNDGGMQAQRADGTSLSYYYLILMGMLRKSADSKVCDTLQHVAAVPIIAPSTVDGTRSTAYPILACWHANPTKRKGIFLSAEINNNTIIHIL